MKPFLRLAIAAVSVSLAFAQVPGKIVCKTGYVKFFSKTPMEDISAETNSSIAIFEPETGKLRVRIPISSFTFPNHLMQEHFNENYLESDKFPISQFEGTATAIDWTKVNAGSVENVTITGTMEIHGVKKNYAVPGTFRKLPDGQFQGEAKFSIHIADHDIKVPAIVFKNIAENVDVTLRLQGVPETKVTYADVAPMITQRCARCHIDGKTTPKLGGFDNLSAHAEKAYAEMNDGSMPRGGPHSSPEELARLHNWIQQGKLK